jgi:hypothetical protein
MKRYLLIIGMLLITSLAYAQEDLPPLGWTGHCVDSYKVTAVDKQLPLTCVAVRLNFISGNIILRFVTDKGEAVFMSHAKFLKASAANFNGPIGKADKDIKIDHAFALATQAELEKREEENKGTDKKSMPFLEAEGMCGFRYTYVKGKAYLPAIFYCHVPVVRGDAEYEHGMVSGYVFRFMAEAQMHSAE